MNTRTNEEWGELLAEHAARLLKIEMSEEQQKVVAWNMFQFTMDIREQETREILEDVKANKVTNPIEMAAYLSKRIPHRVPLGLVSKI